MKTSNIRRDLRAQDPAKLRTWVGICTLTAAAYATIVLFSPGDRAQPEIVAATPTTTAPKTAPITQPNAGGLDPSVPSAAQALMGANADTAEPAPTF